jgi:hypothetical protein
MLGGDEKFNQHTFGRILHNSKYFSHLSVWKEITDNSQAKYFIIKSNCEKDLYSSLKYGVWTSTELGNRRLDSGFRSHYNLGPIILLFSLCGRRVSAFIKLLGRLLIFLYSARFCGVAQMVSTVDMEKRSGVWSDMRWKGYVYMIFVNFNNNHSLYLRSENSRLGGFSSKMFQIQSLDTSSMCKLKRLCKVESAF